MTAEHAATHNWRTVEHAHNTSPYGLNINPLIRCQVCGIETSQRWKNKVRRTCPEIVARRDIKRNDTFARVGHSTYCWRWHHGCAVSLIEKLMAEKNAPTTAVDAAQERALQKMGIDPVTLRAQFEDPAFGERARKAREGKP